jgi:hypothetical protein
MNVFRVVRETRSAAARASPEPEWSALVAVHGSQNGTPDPGPGHGQGGDDQREHEQETDREGQALEQG